MFVWQAVFIAIVGVFLVISTTSNICVIFVVCRNSKMWSITNVLICNIAVSDMILASVVLPQQLHDIDHTDEYFEAAFLCNLVNGLPVLCISTSIFSMVAMAAERYRAIVMNKALRFTRQSVVTLLLCIWFTSTVVSVPTFVEYEKRRETIGNTSGLRCGPGAISRSFSLANGFFVLTAVYVAPQILIYTCYALVGYFVWWKGKVQDTGNVSTSAVSKGKRKVLVMLLLVAALFSVSWCPYFTIKILARVQGTDGSAEAGSVEHLSQVVLSTFSTTYNVVVYSLFNPAFQQGFRHIYLSVCRLCPRRPTRNIQVTPVGELQGSSS